MTEVINKNQNQPMAAGSHTMVGKKISVDKNKVDDYLTPGWLYEVVAQQSPHEVLIIDDDGEKCWIDMISCNHTGGKWSVAEA